MGHEQSFFLLTCIQDQYKQKCFILRRHRLPKSKQNEQPRVHTSLQMDGIEMFLWDMVVQYIII